MLQAYQGKQRMTPSHLLAASISVSIACTPLAAQKTNDTTQAPTRAPDQQTPTTQSAPPTQSAPTTRTPSNPPAIKIDPVKAAKTIVDIFGKKKKKPPAEAPAPTPAPAETTPVTVNPEPTVQAQPSPSPRTSPARPEPRIQPASTPRATLTVEQAPAKMAPAEPSQTVPFETEPVVPAETPAIANEPVLGAPQPAPSAATPETRSWLWLLLVLLAAVLAAAIKLLFFPKPRLSVDFEIGPSNLTPKDGSFAQDYRTGFNIRFEMGTASTPNLGIIQ
jgi:hypothetical protein